MKRLLFAIISVTFIAITAKSQTQNLIGTVTTPNGSPMSGAHVIDLNSRIGVSTDVYGKFQLSIADSGTVLRVSHVGFRPVLQTVGKKTKSSDYYQSQGATIVLSQESTLISQAVVSGSKRPIINGRRGVVLRDFSVAGGNNLLLMAENGERHLVLCDYNWEEISRLCVDKKGDRLHEDCLGNVHLLGDDSVYQIQVNDLSMKLTHSTDRDEFLQHMSDCATSSKSHIFFSSYQLAGQGVNHYGFNRETKEGIILQRVYDHVALNDIMDYFGDLPNQRNFDRNFNRIRSSYMNEKYESLRAGMCFRRPDLAMSLSLNDRCLDPVSVLQSNRNRRLNRNIAPQSYYGNSLPHYFQSVSNQRIQEEQSLTPNRTWNPTERGWLELLSKPTYSPMFKLRDSIFVFDHVLGVCNVHDLEGREIRTFPIEHQDLKGWKNILFQDFNGEKVFAKFELHNQVYLMEIDLNNGAVVKGTQLPDAKDVQHLQVKDGFAYYLKEFRDIWSSDTMLKQKL